MDNNELVYKASMEYSTDDGTETASIIAERIIGQTPFSLTVEGSRLMVTSACTNCETSTIPQAAYTEAVPGSSLSISGFGAGMFAGGFIAATLIIGIILLIIM